MKISGVTQVQFKAADPPKDGAPPVRGARKVVVTSDKAGLTKDDAVKALGKKATRYIVKSWADPTATTEEAKEG